MKNINDKTICLNSKGGRKGIEGLQPSLQDRVYSENGVSPAITTSFNPSYLTEVHVIGQMDNSMDHTFESANRVYDSNGVCPTIPTCAGGNIQPKFLVAASRGRFDGDKNTQHLEINDTGCTNTLTSVQKDNLVIEESSEMLGIRQATEQGYIEIKKGGVADLTYPSSSTRRGRVQDKGDVCPAITAVGAEGICQIQSRYRIRKLTPRECWRLMGYTDADFDKASAVNSNSQLYKEAGNAIVKQVLMAIFSKLNIRQESK